MNGRKISPCGDRVRVEVEHLSVRQPVAWGRVVEAERRGTDFRTPPCSHGAPLRGRCGGCPAMHLTEAARLAALSLHLTAILAPLGVRETVAVRPAPRREGYRNRANYVVERRPDGRRGPGRVVLGSWAPRSHDVARMEGCLVVRPPIDRVARELAAGLHLVDVEAHDMLPGTAHLELLALLERTSKRT